MAGYSKDVNHGAFLRKLLIVETTPTDNTTKNGQNLFFTFNLVFIYFYNRAYIWNSANHYK